MLIGNLEGALGQGDPRPGRTVILDSDPALLEVFRPFRSVIFSLANNHATDRGLEGLVGMSRRLQDTGFITLGAGKEIAEARRPVQFKMDGVSIAILAYCDTRPFVGGIAATDGSPGVAPLIPELIEQDIRGAKLGNDQVWLLLHWGHEYHRYPTLEMRDWAKRWVAAGATCIFGAHPHNLQGMEQINGAQVFYSLGNFIFPEPRMQQGFPLRFDRQSRQTMAVSMDTQGSGCQIRHFIIGPDGWPRPLSARAGFKANRRLATLSTPLEDNYARFFPKIARKERLMKNLRRLRCMTWREILHRSVRLGKLERARP